MLLLDEPLSALDAVVRVNFREEIRRIQTDARGHHPVRHPRPGGGAGDFRSRRGDAGGRIEQVGTPETIYGAPASRFVAGFIGKMNQCAVVVEDRPKVGCDWAPTPSAVSAEGRRGRRGTPVTVLLRPEAIVVATPSPRRRPRNRLAGRSTPSPSWVRPSVSGRPAATASSPMSPPRSGRSSAARPSCSHSPSSMPYLDWAMQIYGR